jgi:predicted 3-demethylubiquinone-9 3-methyltransferase (glyoxalase superfamily)
MAQSIYPCLWFDGQAKAAADFYCSVFKKSKVLAENNMVVMFEINGGKMMALNGGPQHKPSIATSLVVPCDTQEEIDHYWSSLSGGGGKEDRCGWVHDKFGYSWQIVPSKLTEWMADTARAQRVMEAVWKMGKLDIEILKNA